MSRRGIFVITLALLVVLVLLTPLLAGYCRPPATRLGLVMVVPLTR